MNPVKSVQKQTELSLGVGYWRWLSETSDGQIPGGFKREAVDQKDNGDGAGPVRVPLVAGKEGGDKSDDSDRRSEERDLDCSLLECLQ